MSKILKEERQIMKKLSVDYLTLTRRKLDDGKSELLLDVTEWLSSRSNVYLRENERGYDKTRIFKNFFKILEKKNVSKLFLNGLIEEDELLKGLAKKYKFQVKKLIYDNSTDNSIVEKFKAKCAYLEDTELVERDNSIVETNWCHLPMELRQKCIDSMCFRTKLNLRQTSSTEKTLVEYKKHDFDYIGIYSFSRKTCDFSDFTIHIRSDIDAIDSRSFFTLTDFYKMDNVSRGLLHKKKLKIISLIFKFGNIQTLYTSGGFNFERKTEIAAQIAACAPFDIKELSLKEREGFSRMFLLKNVREGLETLELKWIGRHDIEEMMNDPKVNSILMNLKQLQFSKTMLMDTPNPMVTAWIENDKAIGSRLLQKIRSADSGTHLRSYTKLFENRVVNATETEIRIQTDNAESHILIRVFPWRFNRGDVILAVEMIPASLQSSEFTTQHGWLYLEEDVELTEFYL